MHNQKAFLAGNTGAIVVAAGSSSRMESAIPKQFQGLSGRPVLLWSIEALLQCEEITAISVVIPAAERTRAVAFIPQNSRLILVDGGATRTESPGRYSARSGRTATVRRLTSGVTRSSA